MSGGECRAMCPCKAPDAAEAVRRAAAMVGGDAVATFALLRFHGWRLDKATSPS